jgi:hypothetical protein
VTLAPKGLLIEEQRTNLATYSQDFSNAAWAKGSITLTSGIADPAGGTTAFTVTATAANGFMYKGNATTAGTHTGSIYIRRRTGTGAINLGLTGSAPYVTLPVTSTWTRVSITQTVASTTGYLEFIFTTSGDQVDIWGAQLEVGAFATSYIPTVTSQVTRAADSASMIGNNFARWYNVNTGSLFVDYATVYQSVTYKTVVQLTDGSNNYVQIRAFSASGSTMGSNSQVVSGGSLVANFETGSVASPFALKTALAYATNDFASASNGGAVLTDTLGAIPVGLTSLAMIGGTFSNGSTTIKRISYYNRRLANTELTSITS